MLIKTNVLNKEQLQDLEHLTQHCQKADDSVPNLYPHLISKARAVDGLFLYYNAQQELLVFLGVYFFYEEAVEIALLVHPKARRQGLARQMLQPMLNIVTEYQYNNVVFTVPSQKNSTWLQTLGFTYLHREYYMQRQSLTPILDYQKNLIFRKAIPQDIPLLCSLDELCFHKNSPEAAARFYQILNEPQYDILLALDQRRLIGKTHFRWHEKGATLSDIAVFPDYQGQGYGTSLIAHCINHALSLGKPQLSLDVETHNQKALNLYLRLGFLSKNSCDYWQISRILLQNIAKS